MESKLILFDYDELKGKEKTVFIACIKHYNKHYKLPVTKDLVKMTKYEKELVKKLLDKLIKKNYLERHRSLFFTNKGYYWMMKREMKRIKPSKGYL